MQEKVVEILNRRLATHPMSRILDIYGKPEAAGDIDALYRAHIKEVAEKYLTTLNETEQAEPGNEWHDGTMTGVRELLRRLENE